MEIYERIRKVRQDNKLSQAAFAERLGTTRSVISNIEYNIVQPSGPMIKAISQAFGVSEKWIRTGEGDPDSLSSVDEEIIAFMSELTIDPDMPFVKYLVASMRRIPKSAWTEITKALIDAVDSYRADHPEADENKKSGE